MKIRKLLKVSYLLPFFIIFLSPSSIIASLQEECYRLSELYDTDKNYSEAYKYSKDIIKSYPYAECAWTYRALSAQKLGKPDLALRWALVAEYVGNNYDYRKYLKEMKRELSRMYDTLDIRLSARQGVTGYFEGNIKLQVENLNDLTKKQRNVLEGWLSNRRDDNNLFKFHTLRERDSTIVCQINFFPIKQGESPYQFIIGRDTLEISFDILKREDLVLTKEHINKLTKSVPDMLYQLDWPDNLNLSYPSNNPRYSELLASKNFSINTNVELSSNYSKEKLKVINYLSYGMGSAMIILLFSFVR